MIRAVAHLVLLFVSFLGLGAVCMADAAADPATQSLVTTLGNYGFGGLMTAALGYAIYGLYRTHQEERKTWVEKLEKQWGVLLDTQRESDAARHLLVEELRKHMESHAAMDRELRVTLDRIATALDHTPQSRTRRDDRQ